MTGYGYILGLSHRIATGHVAPRDWPILAGLGASMALLTYLLARHRQRRRSQP